MRKLVLNKSKKIHNYTFQEVLRVLYKFIDEESKNDSGEILDEMNRIKDNIIGLFVDLGNLALLDNWYDIKKISKLPDIKQLVNYDNNSGYFKRIKR